MAPAPPPMLFCQKLMKLLGLINNYFTERLIAASRWQQGIMDKALIPWTWAGDSFGESNSISVKPKDSIKWS